MAAGDQTAYLEIFCPEASGQQMIRLARGTSRLIQYQQVHLRSSEASESPGIRLRIYVTEDKALQYWPSVRSLLRSEKLLDDCVVTIGDEALGTERQIWPPAEE